MKVSRKWIEKWKALIVVSFMEIAISHEQLSEKEAKKRALAILEKLIIEMLEELNIKEEKK